MNRIYLAAEKVQQFCHSRRDGYLIPKALSGNTTAMDSTRMLTFAVAAVVWPLTLRAITIPTVIVGQPNNPADRRYSATGFGSVSYAFRMSKWEVTNRQYAAILNSVAASDPYFLYDANMGSSPHGGIIRSGSNGNFTNYHERLGFSGCPGRFSNRACCRWYGWPSPAC